ncbi:MAG TPA: tetratricopeptide repeat protein [Longimicrobiaceae bacterium]|nr:tetratricopeptide repeat protein [Longimicrobiaceae bacterium]
MIRRSVGALLGRLGLARRGQVESTRTPPGRWERIGAVLAASLELPAHKRAAFIDRACAGEPGLRREVRSLLAAHGRSGPLDGSVAEWASPLFAAAEPVAAGGTVSHYRIIERLDGGGMGVVYKAHDLRLERTVALKFLPPYLSADALARERFLAEAQAAAALDHLHICTIHEIGEAESGQIFLAMPFYEGETLQRRIARGPLPVAEALRFAIQAAQGLARAHERGIVHRDIKPANLVITADEVLKILDFGIAKRADVSRTRPGHTPGTVAYMSPEQARGEAVDHRTDIWSLGVVLYEMLTGERPFPGEQDAAVLHAILHTDPMPVAAARAGVPAPLERLLRRALARNPGDRFATALEMVEEMERLRAPGVADALPGGASSPGVPAEGEHRQVAVVVCGLSAYAELVEWLAPEEVERVLRRLRAVVGEVAERHGGTVNRFHGEEVVLLFGVPTAHEDDCLRAVRAALELHERAREMSVDVEGRAGGAIHLHTGIDTGGVVALPTDGDAAYRVVGAAARGAARLSAHAAQGEVWISPECQRLVGPFFETEPRDPVAQRGREPPLVPRRVLGESGLRTRIEAAEKVGLTAYTGRDAELETLGRCLGEALDGEGRFVSIAGEPGLGKSRLLFEFRQRVDHGRARSLHGRCQSHGGNTAYLPFIETVRGILQIGAAEGAGRAMDDVAARIREIGPELEEFLPFYLHLLALPDARFPVPGHLHREQFRLAMEEALAALFTLSARRQPTILLLEDWHWADEASHAVLRQVAEMVTGYPLLVVVTLRPGYGIDWGNPGHHTPIVLRPLEAESSLAMLRSILRVAEPPRELAMLLHERTGGNPFFLEEICQALMEEGALRVEEGRVALAGAPESLDLPDTVQAVIRTRLDRLDRDARHTLRVASVVGREFSRGVLERVLAPDGRLPRSLQTLKTAGLIQQTRVVPDAAYCFKHVLTQEVAYGSLLERQRKELHGSVGEAIEQLHPDRLGEHLDQLARHFSRAEAWEKAVRYAVRAAERAEALARFPEALDLLERAESWLGRLPDDAYRRETRADVLLLQERLCETLGLRGQQQRIVDELISLVEPAGDPARLAEVYIRQGDLYTLLRRFDAAEAALTRSLHIVRELGDAVGERNALRSLGLLRWHEGRNREARTYIEEGLALDRRRGDLAAVLGDLANLGQVLKNEGDLDRARSCLEEALWLMEDASAAGGPGGDSRSFSFKAQYVLHNLANIHRELGDNERALEYLHRAMRQMAGQRHPIQLAFQYTSVAHIYLQQGRVEESLEHYREAADLTRRARFAPGLAQSLGIMGEVLIGLGRGAEALPHVQEAAGIFAQLRDCEAEARMWGRIAGIHERAGNHPDALAAWGRARVLRHEAADAAGEMEALEGIARVTRRHVAEPSLALGYYREALDLAEALADRAAEGRIRNTIGIIEWSRGAHAEALAHYQSALGIFRELADEAGVGLMLNSVAVTLRSLGRREEARARLEDAVEHHRRTGQPLLEGHALAALGDLLAERGEPGRALECYERSLAIRRRIGDRRGEGWMLLGLARVELPRGLAERARGWIDEAARIAGECGDAELEEACERLRRAPGL